MVLFKCNKASHLSCKRYEYAVFVMFYCKEYFSYFSQSLTVLPEDSTGIITCTHTKLEYPNIIDVMIELVFYISWSKISILNCHNKTPKRS